MSGDWLAIGAVAALAAAGAARRGSGARIRFACTPIVGQSAPLDGKSFSMLAFVYEGVGGLHPQPTLGRYRHDDAWAKAREINEGLGVTEEERARLVREAVQLAEPSSDERARSIRERAVDAWTSVTYLDLSKFGDDDQVTLDLMVMLDDEEGEILVRPIEVVNLVGGRSREQAEVALGLTGSRFDALPLSVKVEWFLAAEEE